MAKKLPKGAQSLSDIAKMRGRGGQILSRERVRSNVLFSGNLPEETRKGVKAWGVSKTAKKVVGDPEVLKAITRSVYQRSHMAEQLARKASKLGAIGQIATLPSQLEEYKERMKPLHKKEQERSARGI